MEESNSVQQSDDALVSQLRAPPRKKTRCALEFSDQELQKWFDKANGERISGGRAYWDEVEAVIRLARLISRNKSSVMRKQCTKMCQNNITKSINE